MNQQDFMATLRDHSAIWSAADVPDNWWTEATVVEVDGTLARIQRAGQNFPDQQWYPTVSPYFPVVGDPVMAGKTNQGLIILGRMNRGGGESSTVARYASLDGTAIFANSPYAPSAEVTAYDDRVATTAHVKDVLSNGILTPILPSSAAPKSYVDGAVSPLAPKASPTLTGIIDLTGGTTLIAAPSAAAHPTTKTYVDTADALKAPLASPAFTGAINLTGGTTTVATPSSGTHATNKTYVDTADALKAPLAGPTFTGTVTVAGLTATGTINLTGGTTTVAAPSSGSHATTKTYVDGVIASHTHSANVTEAAGLTGVKVQGVSDSGFTSGQGQVQTITLTGFTTILSVAATLYGAYSATAIGWIFINSLSGNHFDWGVYSQDAANHTYAARFVVIGQ